MRLDVTFRRKARNDLRSIYLFVAEASGSPRVADRVIDRLEAACLSLSHFPHRGRPREDLAPHVRALVVPRLAVILYRAESRRVRILAVVSAGRDVTARSIAEEDR